MEQYRIEGIFINRKGINLITRNEQTSLADIEPFTRTYWAKSANEALEIATQDLNGGKWIGQPSVFFISEAERMRALGAPELPLVFQAG